MSCYFCILDQLVTFVGNDALLRILHGERKYLAKEAIVEEETDESIERPAKLDVEDEPQDVPADADDQPAVDPVDDGDAAEDDSAVPEDAPNRADLLKLLDSNFRLEADDVQD